MTTHSLLSLRAVPPLSGALPSVGEAISIAISTLPTVSVRSSGDSNLV